MIESITEQFIINGTKHNKNVNIGTIISLLKAHKRNSDLENFIKL